MNTPPEQTSLRKPLAMVACLIWFAISPSAEPIITLILLGLE